MAYISSGYRPDPIMSADDYDPGTGDTSGIIIVGSCGTSPAIETYTSLLGMGMDVCLVGCYPEPTPTIVEVSFELRAMEEYIMPFLEKDCPVFGRPPKAINPAKSAPLKTNHIIKQPGPMRRGNRI